MTGPVAALDCGTNSTRLLVAGADGETLVRLMRITRLGQGVDATGRLAREAIERTVSVLGDYRRSMDELGVTKARLVATSAVRDAANGDEFLDAAGKAVGVEAELLSGDEEGRLSYRGATEGLPPAPAIDVVIDIGGGSTELVVHGDMGLEAISLALGCVRLSERYLDSDPPLTGEIEACVGAIDAELEWAAEALPTLAAGSGGRLIGLAGTVSTLASLEQGLADYDRARVHHSVLLQDSVDRWCATLAGEPASARAVRAGMAPGREDVIVGGILVLRQAMARLGFDECLVSESDILDGLVASLRD